MLRIVNLEEIQNMLLRVSDLVDRLDRQDPSFVHEVKCWLLALEEVLGSNRMPVAGNVGVLRGLLISAERGIIPVGIEFHGRSTGRKIREATATDALRRANELVSNAVLEDVSRVAEAERVARQLVTLANYKDLILPYPHGSDHTKSLKTIWRNMSADPDIGPGVVHLLGLLGPHDALIALDRAITADVLIEPTVKNSTQVSPS